MKTRKSMTFRNFIGIAAAIFMQFNSSNSYGQYLTSCGNASGANPSQNASPPSNCTQLLADLVPVGNDKVIEVNVKFFVFQPVNNPSTGAWTYGANATTQADAQKCLDDANAMLASMPAPTQPMNGVTPITNAKIRFVMGAFFVVKDNFAYNNVNTEANGSPPLNYKTTNAINVFLGNVESFNSIYAGAPGIYPDNYIVFHPQFETPARPNWDNIERYGAVFAHEAGHVLGLNHTTSNQNYLETSSISPAFGCCTYAEAIDYFRDNGGWDPCPGVNNPYTNQNGTGSNNIMSQNTACGYQNLSPQQASIMHYNLRTILKNLLTVSGSNAGINSAMLCNSLLDYNVTSNETWNTDRYFKGNVTVKSGKTLTINCGVAMTKGARILVEVGGQLVIQGNGHVTNISDRLWNGVEVAGTPNLAQLVTHPTNTGALLYQGIIRIKNGGTISNAVTGIKNYSNGTLTQGGGVVFGTNANFYNNYIDVDFRISYSNYSTLIPSMSWMYGCNFKTTAKLNEGLAPYSHVYIYKTKGLKFAGCNFEFAAGTAYPISTAFGIWSMDGSYTVDQSGSTPSTFKKLSRGIFVTNANVLPVINVKNSQFIDNVYFGAYFTNSNYLTFDNNYVQNPSNTGAVGVYLNSSKYYNISNNTFNETANSKLSSGLCAYNSKAGVHNVYKNSFKNLRIAINGIEDNSGVTNNFDGLKMRCNNFTTGNLNLWDIAMTKNPSSSVPPTVAYAQAGTGAFGVGNAYGANCSGIQNKWFVDNSSTKAILHQVSAVNTTYDPGSPNVNCKSPLVITSLSSNAQNSCPSYPTSSGGNGPINQRLSNLTTYQNAILNSSAPDINEFQSAICSRIGILLGDSLPDYSGVDTTINLLTSNVGQMEDADIQRVFAYIYKGDLAGAQNSISQLAPSRNDWAIFLQEIIQIEQSPEGIFSLCINEGLKSQFLTRANTENANGREIAQAIIFAACGEIFDEPNPDPINQVNKTSEESNKGSEFSNVLSEESIYESIEMFPNPTKEDLTVYVPNLKSNTQITIVVKDVLGRIVYSHTVEQQINIVKISNLKQGLYFVALTNEAGLEIYQNKVIKE